MTSGVYQPPIFILAAPRSYSSLVSAMIGQHPELYGVPELNLFQCELMDEFNSGRNQDGSVKSPFWKSMRHGLLRTVAQVYSGEQTAEAVRMAERWVKVRETLTSAEAFSELCAQIAPLRVVEKSPGVVRRQIYMQRMYQAFPDAKFIHLVRNPIDQGKSVINAKGGIALLMALNAIDHRSDTAQLEPQILWHDSQVQVLRFLDKVPDDQFVTLRGEDVLGDPDETLGSLCRWLGISDGPEALAAMKQPDQSDFACFGPVNARLGNDANFLSNPGFEQREVISTSLDAPLPWRDDELFLNPRVRDLATELGY